MKAGFGARDIQGRTAARPVRRDARRRPLPAVLVRFQPPDSQRLHTGAQRTLGLHDRRRKRPRRTGAARDRRRRSAGGPADETHRNRLNARVRDVNDAYGTMGLGSHNPKVAGSNPAPATTERPSRQGRFVLLGSVRRDGEQSIGSCTAHGSSWRTDSHAGCSGEVRGLRVPRDPRCPVGAAAMKKKRSAVRCLVSAIGSPIWV